MMWIRRKMKSQLNKIFKITLVILFFTLSKSYSVESVTELTDAISEAREKFNNISEPSTEQSKIIDEAFKEIDKATEYVQEAINNDNAEDAIKTLEFIEKSLADVDSIIPQEFSSDMSNMDTSALSKEEMDIVTEITTQMKIAKEEKVKEFMSGLVEINQKGIDTITISENLNSLGVDTIKIDLNLNLNENKKTETWTKEEWANSYTGSILTASGSEVIADKEVSSKVKELEEKFQEKTLKIESKRVELLSLNNQLDPISSKLESLNEKKSSLTFQYNLEISKLSGENLTNLENQKSIELSEKLQNEIENVTSEALKAEQQSALFKKEISSLKKGLNEQILQSNNISEDISNLNQNKLDLSDSIALQTAKLNELKGQSSGLSSSSNITELTAKLDESEKLKTQLTDLQSQIKSKNLVVSEKITEVNSLNSQLDPLSDQIKSLEEKREALQNQYNSEISNISNSFNNNELVKSQELAVNFNNDINSVTSEIKSIEANSSQIKNDISQITLEITSEKDSINKITFELVNSQKDLDGTLNIISSKEFQLDQLKNTDLAQVNQKLNQQLNQVSLQKDFIQSQFEKSIDLEVEALQRYHTALGDTEDEIDFAMREVGVILDSDPRKARAFEIEKYATYAGLSKDFIEQGINAVNNDDWDTQKNIFKDITKALAKNPNWTVDVPSNAEFNVMIAEEKAIQEAALASLNVEEINRKWNDKITEQAKEFQPLAGLNTTTLKYAVTWEGMAEHEPLTAEIDKILNNNNELKNLTAELKEKQKQLKEIQVFQQLKTQEINNAIKPLQDQLSGEYSKMNDLNKEYSKMSSEKYSYINSIGGYAALQRDKGNSNYGDWVKNIGNFDKELGDITSKTRGIQTEALNISSEINKMKMDNSTSQTDINNWINLQSEVGTLSLEQSRKVGAVTKQARSNIITQVEEAKIKYNELISQKNPELKAVEEKVSSILKEVPTFEGQADNLAGLDATTLRAKLVDLTNGSNNETEALEAARKAMSEMGGTPASKYMTGAYWEMSNVKAAAIVRSKKYDYVDDYEYMNAYYRDPLELNTSERQEVETELKNILGNNNPKLNALNNQVNSLKSEINNNSAQLTNLNENISKLESEIGVIKSSEQNLKSQIAKLNNDITSKQSLINGKNKSLTDLQKNLDPINNKIGELEVKKKDLNNNVQNQINLISQNTKKSEEISQKTSELENKLSKELSEIDQQIDGYKKETEQLTVNISTLSGEISTLENDKPDLSSKITKINEELIDFSNAKAELSVLTQEQKVEVENIDVEINKLEVELTNLKTSENQISQQLASLSNELKSKEDIIKNNNLSISEIQKQINPLNSQIGTLENQKVSLNEQFNKDLSELSNQIEQTAETKSAGIDKLKVDFETQISKLNEEINNFESQTNELNSTVSALDEEIKSIEVDTPQISIQIAKLNQDINVSTNIKANLAIATAKKMGLKVDEKAIQSIGSFDGKAIIVLSEGLVRVVDETMLIDQANKFSTPLSKFSINSKIYSADAIRPEILAQELITDTYAQAKTVREKATERLSELEATPGVSKAEIESATATREMAKYAEIAAGQSVVTNTKITSVATQEITLNTLKSIASTPGMNKWDVRRANAAVKAAEAKIAGINFSYNQAVSIISNDEKKFNDWRVASYKKSIEAAKASGNSPDLVAFERRLKNFQERLVDERTALEEVTVKQSGYLEILTQVSVKNVALSGATYQKIDKIVEETIAENEAKKAADSIAVQNTLGVAGVKTEMTSAYDNAKEAREKIDKNLNALQSQGASKEVIEAAEASRAIALQSEIAAANVVSSNTGSVKKALQQASTSAQKATLNTLKSIANTPGMSGIDVRRANSAVRAAETAMFGATLENTYKDLKYTKEKAVAELNQLKQSGATEGAIRAAEAARDAATSAQKAAVDQAVQQATAAVQQATAAAQDVAAVAQEVSQEVAAVAQEVSQEVAQSAQSALQDLRDIAATGGMNKWDVRRANAAVKEAEAQIAGESYDKQGAIDKINSDEKAWNDARN